MTTVRLKGTWSRKDTDASDVTRLRRALEYGPPAWNPDSIVDSMFQVRGTLTESRESRAGSFEYRDRFGKFNVTVEYVGHTPPRFDSKKVAQALNRAKYAAKWWVQDLTCAPPKLTFDSANVVRERR
jgi:hypothetical protein